MVKAELFQKLCEIYRCVYFVIFLSKLDRREYRKCPQLHFSIWLALDTVFKMSSLQWKTSEIYKCVCVFLWSSFHFLYGCLLRVQQERKVEEGRLELLALRWVLPNLRLKKIKQENHKSGCWVMSLSSHLSRDQLVYLDSGGWRVTQGWMVPQD